MITIAVRKEIVRNMKGMRKRIGHLIRYGNKERNSAQPELLEKILYRDNLNRAFKRVRANKGAPGIDGINVEYTRCSKKG